MLMFQINLHSEWLLRDMAYLLLLFLVTTGLCLEFTPYQPSEKYTCGNFLQDRVEDKTLRVYYTLVNRFIDWISNPFPHTGQLLLLFSLFSLVLLLLLLFV